MQRVHFSKFNILLQKKEKKEMRNYLLTALTAFALGAGTVQLSNLTAKASNEQVKQVIISKQFLSSNPVLLGIWNNVKSAVCPLVDIQENWEPGTCTVENGTVVSITKNSSVEEGVAMDNVVVSFSFDGVWAKGEPE